MAKAVEGCWYSFLNVVPGSFSRYSASWSDGVGLTDMLATVDSQSERSQLYFMVYDYSVEVRQRYEAEFWKEQFMACRSGKL